MALPKRRLTTAVVILIAVGVLFKLPAHLWWVVALVIFSSALVLALSEGIKLTPRITAMMAAVAIVWGIIWRMI